MMMNCRIWERFKMPRLTEMVSLMISTMATTAGYGRGPYTVNISLFKTNIWSISDFTCTNNYIIFVEPLMLTQIYINVKKKQKLIIGSSTSGKCLS